MHRPSPAHVHFVARDRDIMRFRRFAAASAVALVLTIGTAGAAAAAGPLDPGWITSKGINAGEAVLLGMTSEKFPSSATSTSRSSWVESPYGTLPSRYSNPFNNTLERPLVYVLSDPYYGGAGTGGASQWWVTARIDWQQDSVTQQLVFGADTTTYCSATQTGAGVGVSSRSQGNFNTNREPGPGRVYLSGSCPAASPYMLAMVVKVTWYQAAADASSIKTVEHWFSTGAFRLGGRPTVPSPAWCAVVDPTHSGVCLWAPGDNTGGRGGSFGDESINAKAARFDIVCADPPQAEWLSFSWLPDWIGHYVDCLFVPRGGLSLDQVEREIDRSFVGNISRLGSGISSVSMPAERCGVIADSTLNLGITTTQLRIDTCADPWPKFAPIRTTLGVGLIVLTVISSVYGLARVAGFNYSKGQP